MTHVRVAAALLVAAFVAVAAIARPCVAGTPYELDADHAASLPDVEGAPATRAAGVRCAALVIASGIEVVRRPGGARTRRRHDDARRREQQRRRETHARQAPGMRATCSRSRHTAISPTNFAVSSCTGFGPSA